jgi:hypothetical protein
MHPEITTRWEITAEGLDVVVSRAAPLTNVNRRDSGGGERAYGFPGEKPYARGAWERIAVRAGELPGCVRRICTPSARGAYARAVLAMGALSESVSLSDKTTPGR